MKACPRCGRSYADDSLNYCLDDGADLVYGPATDEPATAVFPGGGTLNERSQLGHGDALSLGSGSTTAVLPKVEDTRAHTQSSAEYLVGRIKQNRKVFALVVLVAAVALAGVGFGLYKFFGRDQSGRSGAPFKAIPLATSPGPERNVALSPDGKQVAFVWTGENNDQDFDLYVKIIGAGEPLRLTNTPGAEMSPAWSPDGRYIAFYRGRGEGLGFYIIPALGGAERKLADSVGIGGPTGAAPQAIDWSPDQKTLAIVDKASEDEASSIYLLSIDSGEKRRLTHPPAGNHDFSVSFSPDGSQVAFVRHYDIAEGDVYTVPVTGGEPNRITSDGRGIYGLAWTPDGASIVFSSERGGGGPTLWRVSSKGGTPEPVTGLGEGALEMSIARQGGRMAYAQRTIDTNLYRINLTNDRGRIKADAPMKFSSSTRLERGPAISPDGRKVAFMSSRSGTAEIWTCDAEGKNPAQLTNFGGPYTDAPSWSPDGRYIAFTSRADGNVHIYMISAEGGGLHRLTADDAGEEAPTWSRDGQWIYFTSGRTQPGNIWKVPVAGGAAVQVSQGGGRGPIESPDGRKLYYFKWGQENRNLWQMSTGGGEETHVFVPPPKSNLRSSAVVGRGVYFFISEPRQSLETLEFFDFATHQTTPITTIDGPSGVFLTSSLTISPDERWLLYTQRDQLDFDLMLVENFK